MVLDFGGNKTATNGTFTITFPDPTTPANAIISMSIRRKFMALVINDRVKVTSTTTGTGAMALGSAVTGFETFAQGIGNNNTTYYCIFNQGTTEFEVGLGTLDGSSANLTRTTVISSSNSDAAVNFTSGTKDVFCTLPASKSVYLDATGTSSRSSFSRFCTCNGCCVINRKKIWHKILETIYKEIGTSDSYIVSWWRLMMQLLVSDVVILLVNYFG